MDAWLSPRGEIHVEKIVGSINYLLSPPVSHVSDSRHRHLLADPRPASRRLDGDDRLSVRDSLYGASSRIEYVELPQDVPGVCPLSDDVCTCLALSDIDSPSVCLGDALEDGLGYENRNGREDAVGSRGHSGVGHELAASAGPPARGDHRIRRVGA